MQGRRNVRLGRQDTEFRTQVWFSDPEAWLGSRPRDGADCGPARDQHIVYLFNVFVLKVCHRCLHSPISTSVANSGGYFVSLATASA